MLKAGSSVLLPLFRKLFNTVLCSGHFPSSCNDSIITPVYKKGDPSSPSNYRAVVISSNLGRLFCSVFNTRVVDFTRANNLISDCQIGMPVCQPGMRTSDHILTLKTLIDRCLCKGPSEKLYCYLLISGPLFPLLIALLQTVGSWCWGKFFENYTSNVSESSCVRQNRRETQRAFHGE